MEEYLEDYKAVIKHCRRYGVCVSFEYAEYNDTFTDIEFTSASKAECYYIKKSHSLGSALEIYKEILLERKIEREKSE